MSDLTCVVCMVQHNAAGGTSDAETIYEGNALCLEHLEQVRQRTADDVFAKLRGPGTTTLKW